MKILFTLSSLLLAGCAPPTKPPTKEELWLDGEVNRCIAMGGAFGANYYYDPHSKVIQCYRHPFMRMPKKLFEHRFEQ